ncbi:MAG: zinc-ribbon domain-containing protein [Candidatus Helarchaeota archaeon]
MRWTYALFIISILCSVICIILFLLIPGFPLFFFFFFPPIFCYGRKFQSPPPHYFPPYCSHCGKILLEPDEQYCPHCGAPLRDQI